MIALCVSVSVVVDVTIDVGVVSVGVDVEVDVVVGVDVDVVVVTDVVDVVKQCVNMIVYCDYGDDCVECDACRGCTCDWV